MPTPLEPRPLQTFVSVLATPASDGSSLTNPTYTVVVRTDSSTTGVAALFSLDTTASRSIRT